MPTELYSTRIKKMAASGQPDVYQYATFDSSFRMQVVYIWRRALGPYNSRYDTVANVFWQWMNDTLKEEYGLPYLYFSENSDASDVQHECENFLIGAKAYQVIDMIDLSFGFISGMLNSNDKDGKYSAAITDLNRRFGEHGIGFEFVSGELIRKDSQFIHQEAVKPALGLLNEPGFSGPQNEFLRAYEHLRVAEYQDAIVDANNAFESTMKAICTQRGWFYLPTAPASTMIKTIFDNELVPPALMSQFGSLKSLLESGLPTVRNKMGGHGDGPSPILIPEYMAAYALHLAASNIVLLVEAHKAKP